MRIICDACDSAPAVLFCAADEAALCGPCDEKVHMCNKLASRHVRLGLANPSEVPRCDICENAPAFFYCEIDGSSLCLQCDMIVHVGGKRTHGRYLLLRQRVVFPGDQPGHVADPTLTMQPKDQFKTDNNQAPKLMIKENTYNHKVSSAPALDANGEADVDTKMIDLNARPIRSQGQASNTQAHRTNLLNGDNHDGAGVVPVVTCERETELIRNNYD